MLIPQIGCLFACLWLFYFYDMTENLHKFFAHADTTGTGCVQGKTERNTYSISVFVKIDTLPLH